ncbi:MAG: hypothetical protein CO042_02890 [Parcubacteria group bacterium CG_4_9_14_0_2_um_filter_41_8]|nr:MAG: hypothetical protein AUJ34_02125 [Parcubacteria group bacterium CG1_02_41_12]PIP66887.1 MAG: hypothetical protein COW93_03210 [Parcubacteria group bacterium CG22_combo_CG10-13_8_21_14_all_41_9]PIQ80395.1 MAG: hypothetical protein COV79_00710 [Parcubacteria group bacterium CG11_big_fil_rev_8_21_14_0_20_41_14]PIR57262.1 MAG: hypothetical protein COU72_01895 [Parcubacteria group bacterium CG10_big_fil_rev_8_21_14_0_10_41_35]PIZ81247.1 MAG: hypothetical protein COY02_03015 [Parcubacteria gr
MTTYSHKKTPYLWHAFSILLILVLVVTYLVQINSQAETSYSIKGLEEKKQELNSIIEDKELEAVSARSLNGIALKAKEMNLQDPKDVTFIKIGLSTVAVSEELSP